MKCKYCTEFQGECGENDVNPEQSSCPGFNPTGDSDLVKTKNNLTVPRSFVDAMERWVEKGIYPGDCTCAALCNDFIGFINRADDLYTACARDIAKYIYNNITGECWGDQEKMKAWSDKKYQEIKGGL